MLAGSVSCIPLVRNMLCDKYGKDKILSSEKPMLAIAEGAAILSSSLGVEVECQNCGKTISASKTECPQYLEFHQQVSVGEEGAHLNCSAKHSYFIQLTEDSNSIQYEKIIDENTPLPYEGHRRFFVNTPNQLIISYNLFSDAEDGTIERFGEVFFLIDLNSATL